MPSNLCKIIVLGKDKTMISSIVRMHSHFSIEEQETLLHLLSRVSSFQY